MIPPQTAQLLDNVAEAARHAVNPDDPARASATGVLSRAVLGIRGHRWADAEDRVIIDAVVAAYLEAASR